MNIMRRFTLRSLLQNKKRTAVTIIGVILSVSMITAVAALTASFISLFQRDAIATGGNWHAKVSGIKAADVQTILKSRSVLDCAFGRDVGYTRVENDEERFYFLKQYTPEGYAQMSIRLASGRLPQSSSEVAISHRMLVADLGIELEDTITLQSGIRLDASGLPLADNPWLQIEADKIGDRIVTETFVPGDSKTYTVVGVIEQPEFEHSWSAGYGVLGYLDIAELDPETKLDVWLTVPEVNQDIEENVETLALKINKTESDIQYNSELLRFYGVMGSDRQSRFVYSMMLVMISVIVVASVCLIYNAFAISVAERGRQLGLLSSVGATLRQKRSSIYFEGFVISLIAIPLGIAAGAGGIAITLRFLRPLLSAVLYVGSDVELVMQLPWWAIGVTVLFSLITIFLSVYLPARRASRITPMEAIRLTQEVKLTGRMVKTSRLTRRFFGFEAEIALKNLKRSKKKYRATVVSLVISLALFLTVSQYISLITVTAGAMDEGYNYDISLDYPQIDDSLRLAANREIEKLAEAKEIVFSDRIWGLSNMDQSLFTEQARQVLTDSLLERTGTIQKKLEPSKEYGQEDAYPYTLGFMALDQLSFEAYAAKVGVDSAPYMDANHPMGILINYGVERIQLEDGGQKRVAGPIFNFRSGDVVSSTVITNKMQMDGTPVEITIGALTAERPLGVTTPSFFYTCMVVSQHVLNAIIADMEETDEIQHVQHSVYLTAVRDDLMLEKKLNGVMESNGILEYYLFNIHSAARTERNRNIFLGVLVYGFITLITLICIANIFNTVSTNIALRRKEFAMLRSVGMTPGSFLKMIRYESVFYGLKGLLYGLPLSLLMAYLLFRINRTVLDFAFTLPLKSYVVAVLMILAVVLATMLYASAKVRRENIIEALMEENL